MFHKIRNRMNEEQGFTLIELLVVILIVGILAAIALPTFLGQQKKGQDSEAKSNARNLVSHVESCFAETQTYASCQDANLTNTGLNLGTGLGQVSVVAVDGANGYTIRAVSKSEADSSATFTITKTTTGSDRTCSKPGVGGCKSAGGGTW